MSFKIIPPGDRITKGSVLNQLVDVIQEDLSGSATRRKYQVFVTGGVGPGITSSLFQTIYDQDFSLQTANPILDITVGLFTGSMTITSSNASGAPSKDQAGKYLFASNSIMLREKMDIYQQFAAKLKGDPLGPFTTPYGTNVTTGINKTGANSLINNNLIGEAIFLSFKRLFSRDSIKRETFAMRWYDRLNDVPMMTYSALDSATSTQQLTLPTQAGVLTGALGSTMTGPGNLMQTSSGSVRIITDFNAANSIQNTPGGTVGNLYFADNATAGKEIGLIYYDAGIVVLNARKACDGNQAVIGTVSAMRSGQITPYLNSPYGIIPDGKTLIGAPQSGNGDSSINGGSQFINDPPTWTPPATGVVAFPLHYEDARNSGARFVPDFFYSGSMDNIIDHVASCRLSSGSLTAATFQNNTEINSKIYLCRANASSFNFSSNPTFVNSANSIVVVPTGDDTGLERTFTFITTVGLYDGQNNLLAVGKLSRPVEKNDEKDLTIRVRLDF